MLSEPLLFNPIFNLFMFAVVFLGVRHIKHRPQSLLGKYWQSIILGTGIVMTVLSIVSVVVWNISYRRTWPDPSYQPFEPFAVVLVFFFLLSVSVLLVGTIATIVKWRRSRRKHQ